MDNKISPRQKAIELYLKNTSPTKIANRLGFSRKWVYKWINRYKEDPKGNWFEDRSKATKHPTNKISKKIEDQIVNIRKQLEQQKYAQIGAVSIQYEFIKLGQEPPPVWTINRVIKRNNLTQHPKRIKSKKKVS